MLVQLGGGKATQLLGKSQVSNNLQHLLKPCQVLPPAVCKVSIGVSCGLGLMGRKTRALPWCDRGYPPGPQ